VKQRIKSANKNFISVRDESLFYLSCAQTPSRLMQEKSVLVYDDDTEILRITRLILADEYQQVETCANCEKLFEDIDRVNPDIILMDLWMPEIGGEHAIQLLRANDKTKHIPVIVFSAVNDIEKISQRINATAMLRKPFSLEELRETVSRNIL
jgi:DNA-binding NtrC family response regulator